MSWHCWRHCLGGRHAQAYTYHQKVCPCACCAHLALSLARVPHVSPHMAMRAYAHRCAHGLSKSMTHALSIAWHTFSYRLAMRLAISHDTPMSKITSFAYWLCLYRVRDLVVLSLYSQSQYITKQVHRT